MITGIVLTFCIISLFLHRINVSDVLVICAGICNILGCVFMIWQPFIISIVLILTLVLIEHKVI